MSSIIEGYEYDIFISYRQKDNKGDRWVSEFVEALKTELESTFKEEISVYFDINPHDGLLETDSVDKSLEDKLKCLIFIPIISRTYCDSKSFAWQHEFCAFNKLAKEDQFRRDIRLPNGNVTSRILPVKIHDLDSEDKTLLENELGGVLRCIEFIYKSAGVNRPLRANEDHPQDNLNKTYYRDQINKAANAVKEIVGALKKQRQHSEEVTKEDFEVKPIYHKNLRTKIIAGSLVLLILIVVGYFLIPKLFTPKEEIEKSVAVLPFVNLSNDPEQEYFSDGMVDEILDRLFQIGDLKVISRTSSMRFKNSKLSLKEIAQELGVSAILEGSVRKVENNVRITVQLIDAKTDTHIWSEIYDKDLSDIFDVQSDIAQGIAEGLRTVLTPEEKKLIKKSQTENPEAYNLYLQGRFFWYKRTEEGLKKSVEYFNKALAVDPEYALAYAGLADAYSIQAWWEWSPMREGYEKAKEMALRALEIDKNLAEAHATLGSLLCYSEWKWEEARNELIYAIELKPDYATAHQYYSELLDILGQNKEARFQINIALELDPFFPLLHSISAIYYYHERKYKESLEEDQKTIELDPDAFSSFWRGFFIYIKMGEDIKAMEQIQMIMEKDTLTAKNVNVVKEAYNKSGIKGLLDCLIELELKRPKPSYLNLAKFNTILDKREVALDWLEKALEENIPNTLRVNNDPDFDNLRSEPRFKVLIKKMGLPQY